MHNIENLKFSSSERHLAPPAGNTKIYWILILLLMGFFCLFLYTNRQLLYPSVDVLVQRAVASKVSLQDFQSSSPEQVLFQASGWIEPEPYMIKTASFVEGLVSEVMVLNGQIVLRGDVLATLDDKNLKLSIAEVEADLAAMESELKVIAERIKVASKEAALIHKKQETAEAELARLQRISDILQKSVESLIQKEDARLNVERQRRVIQEVITERDLKEASVLVIKAEENALRQKIESKKASLAKILLDLERTVIRSPIEGIIQKVYVRVGQKVMLSGDNMDSATIADLYDPKRLQVRVDVALADAGGLEIGMPCQVLTDILPGVRFAGTVTSIVGQADLAKNTLQAKVKLSDPHWRLRPEMLARVEFMPLAKKTDVSHTESTKTMIHAYVPATALSKTTDKKTEIWVVSRDGMTAEKRTVTLGKGQSQGWQEIREGVNPGEWVICSNQSLLLPGSRVSVKHHQGEQR